jgi:hypothetical protein
VIRCRAWTAGEQRVADDCAARGWTLQEVWVPEGEIDGVRHEGWWQLQIVHEEPLRDGRLYAWIHDIGDTVVERPALAAYYMDLAQACFDRGFAEASL